MKSFLAGTIKSRRNQTIVDQAIVSGSNFASGIILVRGLGLEQFGAFTVAYSLILLANSIQLSFISSPMITLAALREDGEPRKAYLRGMYAVQLRFCVVVTLLAAVVAGVFLWIKPYRIDRFLLVPFLISLVAFLMQDWLRRYYFATGKSILSIWNDAISYLGQLVILFVLMRLRLLNLGTALWSIAITSAIAFLIGRAFETLRCTKSELAEAWRRSRGFSRDLAVANQLQWMVYQGAMLIGAGVLGAEAAGSVRATQNIVGPVNVAYQAMENLVPLKAAEEMRRGGIVRLGAFLFRFGVKGFALLFIAFLTIALFSKDFLLFFYGHTVAIYSGVLNLQLLYFLLFWPLRQFTYLFRTIERTGVILMASLVAAIVSLLVLYPSMHALHAMGIMVAAVAGQTANLLYMTIAWMKIRKSMIVADGRPDVVFDQAS